MLGNDGNFYGTTYGGGTNLYGTVFRVSPSGSETVLWQFASSPTDGFGPQAGLVQGGDGYFYGTTTYGGNGYGTVFRISPSGTYTSLYSFVGNYPYNLDGDYPYAGLVLGTDGNFYGTTEGGGTNGAGTIFRISPNGSETNLHSFGSSGDGYNPVAGLVLASDGNFYGTTPWGVNGYGTVFRMSPSGSYSILYSFPAYPTDGSLPWAVVQCSDGNIYGTTRWGGTSTNCTYGCGTVFRISPSGTYSNLYSFGSQPNDGSFPQVGLMQGNDGNFYGTTTSGGMYNDGTVFKLTVALNPPPYPINQITSIQIAITNITMYPDIVGPLLQQIANTNIVLSIPSIAGEIYQLQSTPDLTSSVWANEGGTITSIGGLMVLTNPASGTQGFYRFAITP